MAQTTGYIVKCDWHNTIWSVYQISGLKNLSSLQVYENLSRISEKKKCNLIFPLIRKKVCFSREASIGDGSPGSRWQPGPPDGSGTQKEEWILSDTYKLIRVKDFQVVCFCLI